MSSSFPPPHEINLAAVRIQHRWPFISSRNIGYHPRPQEGSAVASWRRSHPEKLDFQPIGYYVLRGWTTTCNRTSGNNFHPVGVYKHVSSECFSPV